MISVISNVDCDRRSNSVDSDDSSFIVHRQFIMDHLVNHESYNIKHQKHDDIMTQAMTHYMYLVIGHLNNGLHYSMARVHNDSAVPRTNYLYYVLGLNDEHTLCKGDLQSHAHRSSAAPASDLRPPTRRNFVYYVVH